MIARLSGKIIDIKPSEIILDVGGVGYRLLIPFSTFEKISNLSEATLHVHTYVRDDQFKLFGFFTETEKKFFSVLISINGVGPVLALNILSGTGMDQFIESVKNDDADSLVKIPGIGRNKAEKIVFELRRKINKINGLSTIDAGNKTITGDALEALVSLGFDEKKSVQAIKTVLAESPNLAIEELIKRVIQKQM